jgi:hypothetical protein
MARKPLFSGNYGSALARVDTAPIVGAGRAQGQTFQQIGGMIQQYQLNKEKRQAEEDAAVGGLMGLSPESLKQFTSRNPKVAGAVEKLISGAGGKREVDLVNAGLAPFIAGETRNLQRRLSTAQLESAEFLNQRRQESATNLDNAFKALDRTRGEIQSFIDDGTVQLENLSPAARRLLDNPSMLASKDPQALKFFASDPTKDAESKLRLSNLERGQKVQKGLDESLGGASNVGALQGKYMKGTLAGQKISNERTQSLTDATRLQMDILRQPADSSNPKNQVIDKQIDAVSSKIKSLRNSKSFTKKDDDEFFNLDSLIEFSPKTGIATISEDASKRDAVKLDSLKKLVEEEHQLMMQQIVNHNLANGEIIQIPRIESMKLAEEENLKKQQYIDSQVIPDQRSGYMSGMNMDYSNLDPSVAELMTGGAR